MKNKSNFKNRGDLITRFIAIIALLGVLSLAFLGMFGGWVGSSVNKAAELFKGKSGYDGTSSVVSYTKDSTITSQNVVFVAGVIRNSGDGWQFIENDKHGVFNCKSISINESKGSICIDYSGIGAKKVISFTVTPDETFSSLGYTCGASVGLDHADVFVYKSVAGLISQVNPNNIISSSGNFWFVGLFEV